MNMRTLQSSVLFKAGLITGVSLVLGLLFDYFFYMKMPGAAFPLYIILVTFGLFAVAGFLNKKISEKALWLSVPLLFFSVMIFVRSSEILIFLNIVASMLLLLLIARLSFEGRLQNFLIIDYLKIFFLPFKFILPLFQTLSDLFSPRELNKDQKVLSQVIKGIVIAVPVLLIFLILFSSADLIFKKYITDLINIDIEPETVLRSVLVLIATLIFTGAYSYIFREAKNQNESQQNVNPSNFGHIESSILLGSVNVLFFIFILVQLAYLFGGAGNISAQGFTYAEYARRGFFELIAVSVISLLLLLAVEKYIVKKNENHAPGFKILSTALVIQVILIMASAFTRLTLYEDAYGFTILRFYSHAFIILLAIVFCMLLYKIYIDKRENAFVFRGFILVLFFLVIMNFFNPEAFIARRNIERFSMTWKLDIYYLSRLSDDAMPEMVKVINIPNEDLRKGFARELYWRAQNSKSPYLSKWQSLNISRMRAEKILDSKIRELEPYKDYRQQSVDLEGRYE